MNFPGSLAPSATCGQKVSMPKCKWRQRKAVVYWLSLRSKPIPTCATATAAAHQASLRAACCSAPTTPTPMPPPVPPPPSLGPSSTRLIKVVPRRTSSCSSFSQLQVDGQDDNGMGDSDCSEMVADEDVPPTTSPAPLQPPSPKTPPTDGAGFKSPAHKSPVGVTGVTEVNDEVKHSMIEHE